MPKLMRFVLAVLAALMLLLISPGCSKYEPQRKPVEKPVKIGFALADLNRDGNKTIKKTVEGQKKKGNAEVTWLDAGNDPAKQKKQLSQLAGKKLKAIVFQPVDPAAAPAMVEQLARQGVKVVVLENLPVNTPVDGYIASDHELIGRLQARFLTEALQRAQEAQRGLAAPSAGTAIRPEDLARTGGGQQGSGQSSGAGGGGDSAASGASSGGAGGQSIGAVDYTIVAQLPDHRPLNVVILRGDPRDQAAREITAALQTALQGQKDINIVGVYDHPLWDPASVPATLAELKSKGVKVDAILANDSGLAMAAVEYLKMGGFDKNVLTVGVGADEKASQALVTGEHDAEVDVHPEMLGLYALEAAVDLARTGHWQYSARVDDGDYSVPSRIVPARLITSKNAYLLQERWKQLKQAGGQQGGGQEPRAGGGQEPQAGGGRDGNKDPKGQQQGQSQQGGQGQQAGQQGSQNKTMLKITTLDGKTMEVQIDGEVKKIESTGGQGQSKGEQGEGGGAGQPGQQQKG